MNAFVWPLLVLGLFACQSVTKDEAHFGKGYKAYQKGDFYTALLFFKPLVEQGHPAAQLMLAKMFANGQGVEEDMGKAELLRNLASVKIYKRPYAPGKVRPANAVLKSFQDRLDYYASDATLAKGNSVPDISQVLTSLDLDSIQKISKIHHEYTSFLEGEAANEGPVPERDEAGIDIPLPLQRESGRAPKNSQSAISIPTTRAPVPTEDIRKSNQISLAILRRSAGEQDPLAMDLLSTAYTKGYYGLTPNAEKAQEWKIKAAQVRERLSTDISGFTEPEDTLPIRRMILIATPGLLLMIGGGWLGFRSRKKIR